GAVSYQANCSGSPTSYNWTVNGATQANTSGVGSYLIPDNPSSSEVNYVFSVIATNVYGQSALASASVAEAGVSNAIQITPGLTGNWYDPSQSGHGFAFEVLPDNRFL